jgi:gag-polyprotein putative aspartyl protease
MPHFTVLIDPRGPLIRAYVGISSPRKTALAAAGVPLPPIVPVDMLIDTGASMSSIDIAVIKKLGLQPTGSVGILTPSTGQTPHQCATYDVEVLIPGAVQGGQVKHIPALAIIEGDYSSQGHHGLIGRDVLTEWRLIYSGPDNTLMMSF